MVPDLTLIVGTDGATTIDPAAGTNGISSVWGGNATVTSYAEIHVEDASGIFLNTSDGNGLVNNYGEINDYSVGTDVTAIVVSAYDNATAVNGGDVYAYSMTGTNYDVTGIGAYAGGTASVTNTADGSVVANAYSGYAYGIHGLRPGRPAGPVAEPERFLQRWRDRLPGRPHGRFPDDHR